MCTTPSVSVAQKSISFPLCFLDGFYVAVQQAWFSNFSTEVAKLEDQQLPTG
jgi:hypothetical protein